MSYRYWCIRLDRRFYHWHINICLLIICKFNCIVNVDKIDSDWNFLIVLNYSMKVMNVFRNFVRGVIMIIKIFILYSRVYITEYTSILGKRKCWRYIISLLIIVGRSYTNGGLWLFELMITYFYLSWLIILLSFFFTDVNNLYNTNLYQKTPY